MSLDLTRRALLGGLGAAACAPAWAQPVSRGLPTLSGDDITLRVARMTMTIDGRRTPAVGINGTAPAPLIRLREGQRARLTVVNEMDEETSLHWHGLLLPADMDGVPGVSFPGIAPRSSFTYQFSVMQAGTYWYHSHSGFQEQMGLYGPLVIDPKEADPAPYDREHVILLSDHSWADPATVFRKLKADSGYYNYQRQTLAGLLRSRGQPLAERMAWGRMRMDPTDISDATGPGYAWLVNGHGPADNWTGLFAAGERVRLRIVNASSMTTFDVRIPGLAMTVVQADGQDVAPVEVDEFQIGVAETYDVIVRPEDRAYTLVAETIDRAGLARATLTPRLGLVAPVPPRRPRPLATMTDMGMGGHGGMAGMGHGPTNGMAGTDHGGGAGAMAGMAHDAAPPSAAAMGAMNMRDLSLAPQVDRNAGVETIAMAPVDRTASPGQGMTGLPDRVLTYRDLKAMRPNPDTRVPSRTVDIHLTGNMERYMWSFDGVKMSGHMDPLPFRLGERVRVRLINDTMMGHPIHLHGHFFELVTGQGDHAPRKHTAMVQPGGIVTFDLTADNPGDWAFHCHLLFHMQAGMMRVVSVRPEAA